MATAAVIEERTASGAADDIGAYFQGIGSLPVLESNELFALCDEMNEHSQHFRDTVYGAPDLAAAIVDDWRRRLANGLVTARMSRRHRDGTGTDYATQIDSALGCAEQALRRAQPPNRSAAREAAEALADADLSLELVTRLFRTSLATRSARSLPRHWREARHHLDEYEQRKHRVIRHNLRLVVAIAKRFQSSGLSFLDLIQEGNLGLIRAVEKFDHTLGYQFSTYAVWWIEQAMVRAVRSQGELVPAPDNVVQKRKSIERAVANFELTYGRPPGPDELPDTAGATLTELDALRATGMSSVSLEAPILGTDDLLLRDSLPEEREQGPIDSIDRDQVRHLLDGLIRGLSEREQQIIQRRFGLLGERETLEAVGQELGLSRERVRQLEHRAIQQLRETLDQTGDLAASVEPVRRVGTRV